MPKNKYVHVVYGWLLTLFLRVHIEVFFFATMDLEPYSCSKILGKQALHDNSFVEKTTLYILKTLEKKLSRKRFCIRNGLFSKNKFNN